MEKDNKTVKKLKSIFWFIIYMIPIIIFLGYFIVNIRNGSGLVDANNYGDNVQVLLENIMENSLFFVNESTITITLNKFINLLADNSFTYTEDILIRYISTCLSWYTITMLIHIIVDFILILPNICKKFLRKGGLDNE